jgi:hypothetical protein
MSEVLTGIARVGFVAASCLGVAAWFAILTYCVKMARRT